MSGRLLLGLSSLKQSGSEIPIRGALTIENAARGGYNPIVGPIHVSGRIYNEAGVLRLSVRAVTDLDMQCDRCGTRYTRPMKLLFERTLADRLGEDEDTILITGDAVVLDEPLTEAFLLELPSYGLCREDCAGLCHRCGCNLNESSCGCEL